MATKDFIGAKYKVGFKGKLCVDDLYKVLEKWFSRHKYMLEETEYKKLAEIKGKKIIIEWTGTKNVSDYHQFQILVSLSCGAMHQLTPRGAKKCIHDCDVSIKIVPILVNDYEEKWSASPIGKFMREFFDRFVSKNRLDAMIEEISSESKNLRDELNSFFNIKKS